MPRIALALLVLTAGAAALAAQPDRDAALEKARAKFQADVAKAEEGLVGSIEKALAKAKAAKDKATAEKLGYELEMFGTKRLLPRAVKTDGYVKQRQKAVAALEAAYAPALKELAKAKQDAEAAKLEDGLNDLVRTARGYGLGLPDLEARPLLVIENAGTGQVVEPADKGGVGLLTLAPKAGRKRPLQCWHFDREEKGFVIRNAVSGQGFHVPHASGEPGTVFGVDSSADRTKEPHPGTVMRVVDVGRREVLIGHATNELVLTVTEVKAKGVTSVQLTQEKRQSPPTAAQRWVVSEAR